MIGLRPGPRFADLVLHVLAHVRASAGLAASVYDAHYVAYCERRLGPASERPLGDDAELLGRIASTHEALCRLGLLAWLFRDVELAAAHGARALAELAANDVDEPRVLAELEPGAELLWCAALLELDQFCKLPPLELDFVALAERVERALELAPGLGQCDLEIVRALCRRGRVRETTIWIGAPDSELGVSESHVIWQACHEATVRELSLIARTLPDEARASERELEQAALVRLAERASSAGAGAEHRAWLAHFGRNLPSIRRADLPERARGLLAGG